MIAPGGTRFRELAEALVFPRPGGPLRGREIRLKQLPAEIRAGAQAMRQQAAEAFVKGDSACLLGSFSDEEGLAIVRGNTEALLERGIYEAALVHAYSATRTNWHDWTLGALDILFARADRERLRLAGKPLPPGPTFTLFRGVAGKGARRKVAGLSWTRSLAAAAWFATRYELADPAVYATETDPADVYFYSNDRNDDDFILRAPSYRRLGGEVLAEARGWQAGPHIGGSDSPRVTPRGLAPREWVSS